jgi:hypothetical protein
VFLQRAYKDEAAGLDPRPNFLRSQAVIAPAYLFEALGLCLDALMRATAGDVDLLADVLYLDGDLAADADTFTAGAEQ